MNLPNKLTLFRVILIPFFVFLVIGIGFCFTPGYIKLIGAGFGVVAIICLISYFVYRSIILNPYYSLLNIAIQNDEIRHEERIRFRERKRLENEEENKITVTEKEKSNIDKNMQEDICIAKKLEEENKLKLVKETTFQVEPKRIIIPKERPIAPMKLSKNNGE